MEKGEARREQQERRGWTVINCRIRGLQRWGRRRGPGSQPGGSMLEQYCAGVLLESSRVNFTAPTQGGKKKKNEEASRLPTVMTLGGVLQHAVAMLASGEDHRSGPRRFLAPNPFRRWRLTGGFIPCRLPGWALRNCCQSADTASRDAGVVTRLAAAPITDPDFSSPAAVSGVRKGETSATGPATFPATLDESAWRGPHCFKTTGLKIRSLDSTFRSLRNLVPPRLGCVETNRGESSGARLSRCEGEKGRSSVAVDFVDCHGNDGVRGAGLGRASRQCVRNDMARTMSIMETGPLTHGELGKMTKGEKRGKRDLEDLQTIDLGPYRFEDEDCPSLRLSLRCCGPC